MDAALAEPPFILVVYYDDTGSRAGAGLYGFDDRVQDTMSFTGNTGKKTGSGQTRIQVAARDGRACSPSGNPPLRPNRTERHHVPDGFGRAVEDDTVKGTQRAHDPDL